MSDVLEKINQDHIIIGLLVVLAVILGTFYIDVGSLLSFQDDGLYNIDSTAEWEENAGVLWSIDQTSLTDDKFTIKNYNSSRYKNYISAANYRTSEINASSNPINLGKLKATGYVNQDAKSGLQLTIYDCSKNLIRRDVERLTNSCFNGNQVFTTDIISEGGEIEVNRDLSNITINDYMHIELFVVSNTTERPNNPTSWNSINLKSN